jgi:hypothetical protein
MRISSRSACKSRQRGDGHRNLPGPLHRADTRPDTEQILKLVPEQWQDEGQDRREPNRL